MSVAQMENARTLAHALGLSHEEASAMLDVTVLVTFGDEPASDRFASFATALLARTVRNTATELATALPTIELVVGAAARRATCPAVWAIGAGSAIQITTEAPTAAHALPLVGPFLIIAAAHAVAAVVRLAIGDGFPHPFTDPVVIDPEASLGGDMEVMRDPIDIGHVYLAGAGAIGNGFLLGLSMLDVRGRIDVVDSDVVSDGNLNRCFFFHTGDVGETKASRLVARAASLLPGVHLVQREMTLQELPERSEEAWLERLVVAVDSRRARRRLQEELPRDVFDASTTGIEEVVLHFNSALCDGACMACIYRPDVVENAHEQHVADVLGVSAAEVKQHSISQDAAVRIASKYTDHRAEDLVGEAYDSLFKALCGTAKLKVDQGRQVLAPFGFVSVLAGAYLAIEFARRVARGDVVRGFNYWRVSPWASPVFELRSTRSRRADCECCGRSAVRVILQGLWGVQHEESARSSQSPDGDESERTGR